MLSDSMSGIVIFLAGFMGTGKTSVGRCLAEKIGFEFLDIDTLIETEAGTAISDIFRTRGEPWFRRVEARAVRRAASSLTNTAISLGGGALIDQGNVDEAKRAGVLVWLRSSPEAILARLSSDPANSISARPVLRGQLDAVTLRQFMSVREPGYRQAHITVDTDNKSLQEVAREVTLAVSKYLSAVRDSGPGVSSASETSTEPQCAVTDPACARRSAVARSARPESEACLEFSTQAPTAVDAKGRPEYERTSPPGARSATRTTTTDPSASPSTADLEATISPERFSREQFADGPPTGSGVEWETTGPDLEAKITAGSSTYPCLVGYGTLGRLGRCLPDPRDMRPGGGTSRHLIVVSTCLLRCLLGEILERGLRDWSNDAVKVVWATVPEGERAKSLSTVRGLYDLACAAGARRDCLVVALGGGAVGDVAGFFAATYMRGVNLIHVPTTLLAMVDSAIGGKTAVNLRAGKNLAGAFWQPVGVISDVATLRTLPPREFTNGLAEVVKAAIIGDPVLFDMLDDVADAATRSGAAAIKRASRRATNEDRFAVARALQRDPDLLQDVICRAIAVKAGIVSRDERDTGDRLLLNLGHTLGHAIEQVGGFRRWTHGEAVAIGLAAACRVSTRLGHFPAESSERVANLLSRIGLPTSLSSERVAKLGEKIKAAMALDKKAGQSGLKVILPSSIGQCFVLNGVPAESLLKEMAGISP